MQDFASSPALGLFVYAVLRWARIDFGPLDDSELPRIIVLGLTLVVIGLQAFFSAFLLGVLEIPVKGRRQPDAAAA